MPHEATHPETRWTPLTRLGFRVVFCYFVQYILCCGNATVWQALPLIGVRIEGRLARPYRLAGRWLANHVFHLQGASARIHLSATTDKANDYLASFVMLLIAIVATVLWSALDRRRTQYKRLWLWLSFGLRLALALSMLTYGFIKIFPIQFPSTSLAILNEPVGNVTPLSLLWALLGSNHHYEFLCGLTEVSAGLLLLYRRTALLGALFSAFVLSNVVLYNFFFDVPVKLYAAHILAMAFFLAAPDFPALFRFFWRQQPVVVHDAWTPSLRGSYRYAPLVAELLVLLAGGIVIPMANYHFAARERASLAHPSPLIGQWHLDAAVVPGTSTPRPFITSSGEPMSDIFLEPNGRTNVRSTDNLLWRGGRYGDQTNTLRINSADPLPVFYNIQQPDPAHMVLVPTPRYAPQFPELYFTRVPLATHYALYERGFHFINEWGFER